MGNKYPEICFPHIFYNRHKNVPRYNENIFHSAAHKKKIILLKKKRNHLEKKKIRIIVFFSPRFLNT